MGRRLWVILIPSIFLTQCQKRAIPYEREAIEFRPLTGLLKGEVVDAATYHSIPGALLTFVNTDIKPIYTDREGRFSLPVQPRRYKIRVTAAGYAPGEVWIDVPEGGKMVRLLLEKGRPEPLKPVEISTKRSFSIYFDKGSSYIRPEFYPLLSRVAGILKENPSMRAEIKGYTDSVGDELFNLRLSQKRAFRVRDYLTGLGVSYGRLTARGYGERFPSYNNRTIGGRRLNRRVDVILY